MELLPLAKEVEVRHDLHNSDMNQYIPRNPLAVPISQMSIAFKAATGLYAVYYTLLSTILIILFIVQMTKPLNFVVMSPTEETMVLWYKFGTLFAVIAVVFYGL
jgi:hypothetical protein